MRTASITRKKRFAGGLIPYFVFVEGDGVTAEADLAGHPVGNGETIVLPIPTVGCTVRVLADTSSGRAESPAYAVPPGERDVALTLETKYSWIKGTSFALYESKE